MKPPREERKRNRAIILLLLPAVIFLWVVGWSLYWIGHQRERRVTKQSSSREEEHVHLIPAVLEDLLELRSK